MNYIEEIKDNYSVGDVIRISSKQQGIKEGKIVSFGDAIIKIQPLEKGRKPFTISVDNIEWWDDDVQLAEDRTETIESSDTLHLTQNEVESHKDVPDEASAVPAAKGFDTATQHPENIAEKEKTTELSTSKYKPGDVIPLEELHKIDPKLKNRKAPKSTGKLKILGSGLEVLESLVKDEHQKENEKIIPAIGVIDRTFPDRKFGFIKGSDGKNLYFSFIELVDSDMNSPYLKYQPVVYTTSTNYEGSCAKCIHKPRKISELLKLAQSLANNGDVKRAINVTDHILAEYPGNYSADKLKREISKLASAHKNSYQNYGLYAQAKKYDQDKLYDLALDCYFKALEKGERVESCIKDIASIYAALYRSVEGDKKEEFRTKAMDFLSQYEMSLPNSLSTWQHLENIYYSIKDFDNFFRVADILLHDKFFTKSTLKHITLLTKKAAAYIQLNDLDNAGDILDEVLSYSPNNVTALKLKDVIKQTLKGDFVQIDDVISETEFDSLTSGLSPYILQTLDEYDEYAGVKTKDIESKDFTLSTLKAVREVIEKAGAARAKERANYLLTEGKLMLALEPTEEIKLRTVMARYCNAMALSCISENGHLDTVRFFYNEAFALEENFDSNARQIALYLYTHLYSYSELIDASGRNNPIDSTLKNLLSKSNYDPKLWESLLTMFLYNRDISAKIIIRLYDTNDYKIAALKFLEQLNVHISPRPSKDEFVAAWNEAREKRISDYKRVTASIKSMANYSTIDNAILPLATNLKTCRNENTWLCSLDISRINNIITNIYPAIENYVKTSGYRNKEATRNNSKGQIRQLIEDIKTGPTKLSYEAILPLIRKLDTLLDISFENVIKTSEPKLQIVLLSDDIVVDSDDIVPLQVQVSTDRNSSPIREISLRISNTQDVRYMEEDNTMYNAIEGGDNHIFKLRIKVSEKVKNDKATALNVICKYKNGEDSKECEEQVSLKLYSAADFEPVENPYAPIADGGPVPIDSNMFFGREDFINNRVDAILKSPSKQIIIYGQKRCGKSSVLLHLKKQLQDTGKVFCVLFSIGDIIQNLSAATFYYKILKQIKDELELLEFDGEIVPQFDLPKLTDFKSEDEDNPSNTFTKLMTLFKLSCKRTTGWEDKKLVVMIDEFTYIYTEIKKGNISDTIMKQWKAITQNERAQFSVVLVGQDVVPAFKKEDYAKNAFGVIEDIRLTYLLEEPAKDLIIKPILDKNNQSRYIGNAVDCIMDYTSRNPYYIQIFCSRLVEHMNSKKLIKVTEADVKDVAESFVKGEQALSEEKFDNLIRAGETEDLQEYPDDDILNLLHNISVGSKNIGYCNRNDIDSFEDKDYEDKILKNLVDREVLEEKNNNYKIQVKLFQEWLLNH